MPLGFEWFWGIYLLMVAENCPTCLTLLRDLQGSTKGWKVFRCGARGGGGRCGAGGRFGVGSAMVDDGLEGSRGVRKGPRGAREGLARGQRGSVKGWTVRRGVREGLRRWARAHR